MTIRRLTIVAAIAVAGLAIAAPVGAVENPPTGVHPSTFATDYKGCLGNLRSEIAKGNYAWLAPFGEHFTGSVNPGAHQGTVSEEEFLRALLTPLGITDIQAFCAGLE
jgi:hypothetical protein